MGGLISTHLMKRRPELFRGAVLAGTPFGSVPLILWALRRGAPLVFNRKLINGNGSLPIYAYI